MTENKKILAIVKNKEQAKLMIPYLKNATRNNYKVVTLALDYKAEEVLKTANSKYEDLGKFLGLNNIELDKTALRMAYQWGEIGCAKQELSYKGVFLGQLPAYDLTISLTNLLVQIEVISNAISIEKPNLVMTVDDKEPSHKIAVKLAKNSNIPIQQIKKLNWAPKIPTPNFMTISVEVSRFRVTLHLTKTTWLLLKKSVDMFGKLYLKTKTMPKNGNHNRHTAKKLLLIDFNVLEYPILLQQLVKEDYVLLLLNERRPLGWSLSALRKMSELGLKYKTLSSYSTFKANQEANAESKFFYSKWKALSGTNELREFFSYKGISFLDIAQKEIDQLFENSFSEGIQYMSALERFLSKEHADAILMWNDSLLFERSAIGIGKKMVVPSIVIQHGLINHPISNPILADKCAVWGKAAKDWFVSTGNDPGKIVVTGNPKLVSSPENVEDYRETVFKSLKIQTDKKLVVFASQPIYGATKTHYLSSLETQAERTQLLRALANVRKEMHDIFVVIKLHPTEDYEVTSKILAENGIDVPMVRDINIYKLLYACDLVLTVSSTVGVEAMLCGKPVVTINLTKRNNLNPYAGSGAVLEVQKEEDLPKAIHDALYNIETKEKMSANAETFIQNNLNTKSNASQQIIKLINETTVLTQQDTNKH